MYKDKVSYEEFSKLLVDTFGTEKYSEMLDLGRLSQAYAIHMQYPNELHSYLRYRFKGDSARIDEFKAFELLLGRRFDKIQFNISYKVMLRDKAKAARNTREAVRLFWILNTMHSQSHKITAFPEYARWRMWCDHKTVPDDMSESFMEDTVKLERPDLYADYRGMNNDWDAWLANLKSDREYPALAAIINDLILLPGKEATHLNLNEENRLRSLRQFKNTIKYAERDRPEVKAQREMAKIFKSETFGLYTARAEKGGLIEPIDILYHNAKDAGLTKAASYLNDLCKRLRQSTRTRIHVCKHENPLEDIVDDVGACISGEGSERESSIVYALDKHVHIISLDCVVDDEKERTMGKAILVECTDLDRPPEKVLLVDGVLYSRNAGKFLMESKSKHLSPQAAIYEAILLFSQLKGYPKVIVNISHGRAQQCTHNFVYYVAGQSGLSENEHYIIQESDNLRMFRLTAEGEKRINVKQRKDGLKYTHHLKKEPMIQEITDAVARNGWNGEIFLHSFYMNDAHLFIMEAAKKKRIESKDPEEILEILRSDKEFFAVLSQKDFNWTKADGHCMGIELNPSDMRIEKSCGKTIWLREETRKLGRNHPARR